MKSKIIARIIIYCTIIILLLSALIVVLAGKKYFSIHKNTASEQRQTYEIQADSPVLFPIDGIHSMQIEWAAGKITVIPDNVDSIQIFESKSENQEPMSISAKKDTIRILFQKNGNVTGFKDLHGKDLNILIPKDWNLQNLTIDAASADIRIQDAAIDNVAINTASGECHAGNCEFDKLEINTASGNIYFQGSLLDFSCDAASADAELVVTNQPDRITMDAISGKILLTLPLDCGFRIEQSSLSGHMDCDFPLYTEGKHHIHGNAGCDIEISSVSGDLVIRQGDSALTDHAHH